MRRACLPCLALALLVAWGSPAAYGGEPTPILLPEFIVARSVGDPDIGATATRWLQDAVVDAHRYRIVSDHVWLPGLGSHSLEIADPPSSAAASALHEASGARFLVQGRLAKWGERYSVEVRIYGLPSGEQRLAERLMVDELADVPPAITKIGERVFRRDPDAIDTARSPGKSPIAPAEPADEPELDAEESPAPRMWPYEPLDHATVEELVAERFPEMAYIPESPFVMGTDSEDEVNDVEPDPRRRLPRGMRAAMLATEKPAHEVLMMGFLLDKKEVTNAEFKQFRLTHVYPAGWDEIPVSGVSWPDAVAYARSVGKRLPTEAEWERAARGTEGRRYPWGNDWRPDAVAFAAAPQHVGSHPDGRTPEGIFNMAGNVQEWTASVFTPYPGNGYPNRAYDGRHRVVRGSHWLGNRFLARGSARFAALPGERGKPLTNMNYQFIGFRCARDVPPLPTLYRWLEEE